MSLETHSSSPSWATCTDGIAKNLSDIIILLARIALVYLFYSSVTAKLGNFDGFVTNSLVNRGVPMAQLLGYLAVTAELVGGLAVLFGIGTRYGALLLLLFVIVASFIGHRYWTFTDAAQYRNQHTHFYKNLCIVGGFLLLFVTGGGKYSLDHMLGRKS